MSAPVTVTQADREAWEVYGPALLHGDMTGSAIVAAVRIAAETASAARVAELEGALEAMVAIAERLLERGYVSEHCEDEREDHVQLVAAITKARGAA